MNEGKRKEMIKRKRNNEGAKKKKGKQEWMSEKMTDWKKNEGKKKKQK